MKRKPSRPLALQGSRYVDPRARVLLARSVKNMNLALQCLGELEALEATKTLETALELPAPLTHAELAPLLATFSERVEQAFARGAAAIADPALTAALRRGANQAASDAAFFAGIVAEEGRQRD
ncbi:MAG: hypothetical protein MUF34_36625 [Polyangiaceae bacterium]|jgi:hypothetical protein|nr:hypothetical protein [Polyangiaceae bacterium]